MGTDTESGTGMHCGCCRAGRVHISKLKDKLKKAQDYKAAYREETYKIMDGERDLLEKELESTKVERDTYKVERDTYKQGGLTVIRERDRLDEKLRVAHQRQLDALDQRDHVEECRITVEADRDRLQVELDKWQGAGRRNLENINQLEKEMEKRPLKEELQHAEDDVNALAEQLNEMMWERNRLRRKLEQSREQSGEQVEGQDTYQLERELGDMRRLLEEANEKWRKEMEENKRLRKALEKVVAGNKVPYGYQSRIARAALAAEREEGGG